MEIIIRVHAEENKKEIECKFKDILPGGNGEGKLAVTMFAEFLIVCAKDCKSMKYGIHEMWVNKEDGELVPAIYWDIKHGEGIVPDVEPEEVVVIFKSLKGKLTYRMMQVIWCELFCDMEMKEIARELKWSKSTIEKDKPFCLLAFGVEYFNEIKTLFSILFPLYIYSKEREVKVKVVKARVKKGRGICDL